MAEPSNNKKSSIIILVVFIVILCGLVALIYNTWKNNGKLNQELQAINQEIAKQQTRIKIIPELKQKRNERIEAINELTKILPTETEASHSEFVTLINEFEKQSGVVIDALQPPKESTDQDIKRYRYQISLKGTFQSFLEFLNLIERHKRFLKVDSFSIVNQKTSEKTALKIAPEKNIALELTTYTYNPKK